MNDVGKTIVYLIEKCLRWLYVTRRKNVVYRVFVSTIIFLFLALIMIAAFGLLEMFLLYNLAGKNSANFFGISKIVFSILILIILLNWGTKQSDYSKELLTCYWLIKNREKKKHNWVKGILIVAISTVLILALTDEIDRIAILLKASLVETLIVGFGIITLFVYIPLTESIIDEMKFYKTKSIASVVLLAILLIIYMASKGNVQTEDMSNVYDIMIFSIGQLAFAESAIANLKCIYKKMKEDKKEKISEYFQEVDKEYEELEREFQVGIQQVKCCRENLASSWCEMNWTQKIKCISVTFGTIIFLGVIAWICIYLLNRMLIIEQQISSFLRGLVNVY